jgi:phosphoribosyl 1,2-cyclic phosphodiesterase
MRIVSLGSGSSGNALLVEAGPERRTKLLVDAGLSMRVLTERMRLAGVMLEQLSGVLITHEHSDHVLGLPSLLKRSSIPLISDVRTYQAVVESITTGALRTDSGKLAPIHDIFEGKLSHMALPVGSCCTLGDVEVTSFATAHDAVAPCGYLLTAGGCRVCMVTDTGEVTETMLQVMQHADLLVLESNHDRQRLLRGPYPYKLKQRILSSTGHLSNDQAAEAVLRTWRNDSVRWLWLAHLSRTNNTPTLALETMRAHLRAVSANLAQVHLAALPPGMGHVWDSTQLWHTPSLWEMYT